MVTVLTAKLAKGGRREMGREMGREGNSKGNSEGNLVGKTHKDYTGS